MMTSTLMEFPERLEITLRDGIPAIAWRGGEIARPPKLKPRWPRRQRPMDMISAPGFGRRAFLGGVFSAAAAGSAALGQEMAPAPKPARNPLIYQFKIGEVDAWSISDGHSLMGRGNPLGMMWPEKDRPEMKRWMEERNERMTGIPLYINQQLRRLDRERTLGNLPAGMRSFLADVREGQI